MIGDNDRLICRKAKDGINYEVVVQHFCGDYYDYASGGGATIYDAKRDLINSLHAEIYMAEKALNLVEFGIMDFHCEK